MNFWNAHHENYSTETLKDYPTTEWEMASSAVYMQAQGIRHPDGQSYTGHAWYRTTLDLTPDQAGGAAHLMMPGLFNEAWLYVNGVLVAHRDYKEPWWMCDYKFEWDVDVTGALKSGQNVIALRVYNPSHFGGMFRRPFLYRPIAVVAGAPAPPVTP
jgi:hypothetical protein